MLFAAPGQEEDQEASFKADRERGGGGGGGGGEEEEENGVTLLISSSRNVLEHSSPWPIRLPRAQVFPTMKIERALYGHHTNVRRQMDVKSEMETLVEEQGRSSFEIDTTVGEKGRCAL